MGSFRPGLAAVLSAGLLTSVAATVAPTASFAATGGSISGTVTAAGDDAPLENVIVYARNPAQVVGDIAETDAFGRYTLTGLADGFWTLQFVDRYDTYASEYYDDAPTRAEADPVQLDEGQQVTGIGASLALQPVPRPGTDLWGIVRTPAGDPIVDANVLAFEDEWDPEEYDVWAVESVETDRFGRYFFRELDPGATGDDTTRFRVMAEPLDDVGEPYPFGLGSMATWSGNQTRFRRASAAQIPASGVDITLRRYAGISGTVTEAAGPLTEPADVVSFDSSYWESGAESVDSSGSYSLLFLDPDEDHRVQFLPGWAGGGFSSYVPSWYSGASGFDSATPVAVTDGQVTGGVDGVLGRELVNHVRPALSGEARAGATLSASPGRWNSEDETTFEYSWVVDGKVVGTGPSFVPLRRHAGLPIHLRVTARYGSAMGSATSVPVTLARELPKINVHPRYLSSEDRIRILVRVFAAGGVNGATLTFRDKGSSIRTRQVLGSNYASFQVLDPRPGKHRLVFRFLGTKAALPSKTIRTISVPRRP